jgi:DNA-binding LacI/PurR family transcriptional regulator
MFQSTRSSRWSFLLVLSAASQLAVAGCQSNVKSADVLDVGSQTPAQSSASSLDNQVLGKGSAPIALLLPLSGSGVKGEQARKIRDGAQLAMNDLGNDLITLTIEDTRGDARRATDLAVAAMGSKVIIGPSEPAAVAQLTRLAGKRPPILALAENFDGSPGVYAVRLSEADSAAAGAAALAAKGSRKFVLLVPQGPEASIVEKRVANSLSIYGASLAVTIPVAQGQAEKAASEMKALVADPDAIVVATGDENPVFLVNALKAVGLLKPNIALIGTNRWLENSIDPPILQGAYVATVDATEMGPIADRFKARFGYDADTNVAYGYDMVALVSGITGALGPDGLRREAFQTRSGFRGSTGVFRFRADGGSERSMPFYRIEGGKLKKIAKSTSGF